LTLLRKFAEEYLIPKLHGSVFPLDEEKVVKWAQEFDSSPRPNCLDSKDRYLLRILLRIPSTERQDKDAYLVLSLLRRLYPVLDSKPRITDFTRTPHPNPLCAQCLDLNSTPLSDFTVPEEPDYWDTAENQRKYFDFLRNQMATTKHNDAPLDVLYQVTRDCFIQTGGN